MLSEAKDRYPYRDLTPNRKRNRKVLIARGAAENAENSAPSSTTTMTVFFSAYSAAPRDQPGFAVLGNCLAERAILSAAALARPQSPVPSPQSPVVSPQSSVVSPQSPVPSPRFYSSPS